MGRSGSGGEWAGNGQGGWGEDYPTLCSSLLLTSASGASPVAKEPKSSTDASGQTDLTTAVTASTAARRSEISAGVGCSSSTRDTNSAGGGGVGEEGDQSHLRHRTALCSTPKERQQGPLHYCSRGPDRG